MGIRTRNLSEIEYALSDGAVRTAADDWVACARVLKDGVIKSVRGICGDISGTGSTVLELAVVPVAGGTPVAVTTVTIAVANIEIDTASAAFTEVVVQRGQWLVMNLNTVPSTSVTGIGLSAVVESW